MILGPRIQVTLRTNARRALLGAALSLAVPSIASAQRSNAEARARFEAGVAASHQGRWQDALREFEQAHGIQATAPVLYSLRFAQRAVGPMGEAKTTFCALIEQHGARLANDRRAEIQGYIAEADRRGGANGTGGRGGDGGRVNLHVVSPIFNNARIVRGTLRHDPM